MCHATRRFWVAASIVTGVALASAGFLSLESKAHAKQTATPSIRPEQLKLAEDLSAAFEYVAQKVRPSVVSVSSIVKLQPMAGPQQAPSQEGEPWFRHFFGDDFLKRFMPPNMPRGNLRREGRGSGVIVSEDGYILTNNHVVRGADQVNVTTSDHHNYKAKVVGTDPRSDLAVLKIRASGLVPAQLGDSDKVKPGEWVVAAGDPFGLTDTITSGIVSAKGRANVGVADYEDFIQTDAAINPGNSGGPLVDLRGEVIGINTAIASRNGGYMGVGFAIPSNMAQSIMHSLIKHGKVVRGWLGIAIQNLDEGLAKSFGYKGTEGVLVGDVTPNTPASKAGVKQGDIIVRYDGKTITDVQELRSAVAATTPDTRVGIEVFRNGKTESLTAQIGELKPSVAGVTAPESAKDLGMTVKDITPAEAKQLGLEGTNGVLVESVEPFGPAAMAGVRVNDVILQVQGKPVTNVAQFHEVASKIDLKKGARLMVKTGSMQRFVFIQIRG